MKMLFPPVQALLIAACAGLAYAALSPYVARARLGHALLLSLPIAAAATGLYMYSGIHPAITLVLTCAVCTQLLGSGSAILMHPTSDDAQPTLAMPAVPMTFAMAIIILLGGSTANCTPATLIALALCALLSLNLLRTDGMPPRSSTPTSAPRSKWPIALAAIVSILPCLLIGFVVEQMLTAGHQFLPTLPTEVLLVVLICPAVIAPALIACVGISSSGDLSSALGLSSGLAMVITGIMLPGFILADFAIASWHGDMAHLAGLPPVSWRLDAPPLITAGFAMLGLRVGLLRGDRWVGLLLVMLYLGYLLANSLLRLNVG